MSTTPTGTRRAVTVPCTVDIEQTAKGLHAHVVLDGVKVWPGDVVTVHDAPTSVAFGESIRCRRSATIVRASRIERAWIRLTALFDLTALYEVGFMPRRPS